MRLIAAVAALTVLAAPVSAQKYRIGPFGTDPIPAGVYLDKRNWMVGQKFDAPAVACTLDSVSMFITEMYDHQFTQISMVIYQFTPQRFLDFNNFVYLGPWQPTTSFSIGWNTWDIGVPVVPGKEYLAALQFGVDYNSNTPENEWWWYLFENRLVDPTIYVADSPDPFKNGFVLWAPGDLDDYARYGDGIYDYNGGALAFSADFSTVTPEPSTWILLGTGLAGVGLVAYRRNRKKTMDGASENV